MNQDKLLDVISRIDSELDDYFTPPAVIKKKTILRPLVAACLALVLTGGGIGVFAIAAEAVEYREAVTFFTENKLSTEGLTRSEIKAVYHDINMKTFSYAKTAEVLNTLSVELHETDLGFFGQGQPGRILGKSGIWSSQQPQ